MTHKEILAQYLGSRYQEDPQYGYQCVSWVKKYCELAGFPILWFSWSAINAWKTSSPFGSGWTKIANGLLSVPKAGDIVFFDATPTNPYGHVAVANEKSSFSRLNIIDQNGWNGIGDGIGDNAIALRNTPYSATKWRGKCLGWYRYGKAVTIRNEEWPLDNQPLLQEDPLIASNKIGGTIKSGDKELPL